MPEALRTPVIFCEAGPLNCDAQGAHSKATSCSQGHRRGPLDTVTLSPQEGRSRLQPRGSPSAQPRGDSESPDRDTSCCAWLHDRLLSPAPGVSEVSARKLKERSFLLTGRGGGGHSSTGAWGGVEGSRLV